MLGRINLVSAQAGMGGEGAVNVGPGEGRIMPPLVWKSHLPQNIFLLVSLRWRKLYHSFWLA